MNRTFAFWTSVFWLAAAVAAPRPAPVVTYDRERGPQMAADAQGNRIPDFSVCGYGAGAKVVPSVPVEVIVPTGAGDATARIQAAVDLAATLPPQSNGFRGAVLLPKGVVHVSGSIVITNSGVVLRGHGVGDGGTLLLATGKDRRTVIRGVGTNDRKSSGSWKIVDAYVPVGATAFQVDDVSSLKVGQRVRVVRPCAAEWIAQLSAAEMGGGVGGGWKPGSREIAWDATVTDISGTRVSIDSPITTALEAGLGGGELIAYEWPGRLENIGIENFIIEAVVDPRFPKDEDHAWGGASFENVQDAWVRQITFRHLAGSAVALYETASRVTVQDCLSLEPVSEPGGYRRHTFFTMGQQTLFLRCYSEQGRHDFSVGDCAPGPNAFVQCEAVQALADSGPIQSWASGVLYDNVAIDGNAITLGFRPGNNAAIGWSAANCVLWNCSAAIIRCWNPPGAKNWSFGSWAGFEGDGVWRSSNDFMDPSSLYQAQMQARLGRDVAERLQLMPKAREESSNPPVDRAQELAAAAHKPPPLLRDYILSASTRDRIDTSTNGAIQGPPPANRQTAGSLSQSNLVVITNGWLTIGGKLATGRAMSVPWWRGSIRPSEAQAFGPAVTRFVPGRHGMGFTDNLWEVADAMQGRGAVALDHNYGLWLERRRDDHERVRRMNGDVLPPFYEQPFARSGTGVAWDGLTRYDLTRYNPWYWSRLAEFGNVCDARGLLLFHQNYFQHNILEAGAHWADFPWRSANNINETGFPEPPPYAGDKRIFQAELFYDTEHPVRRKLHAAYIEQCLNAFTNSANVIQFTSAEFTGPLHFVQFWLDTISAWESSRQRSPLIALSTTKDVQDAILSDSRRASVVDIIDFRYWWRTGKGEFAPPGGKNLAPRQFERQWRGGRPQDADLAGMAAEYRRKIPGKPLICDFDSASWNWLCAGGSLPRLPRETDEKLLHAIPRMQFWPGQSALTLREPGRQYLALAQSDSVKIDLSGETGTYKAYSIDTATGKPRESGTAEGGAIFHAPAGVRLVWLQKD